MIPIPCRLYLDGDTGVHVWFLILTDKFGASIPYDLTETKDGVTVSYTFSHVGMCAIMSVPV